MLLCMMMQLSITAQTNSINEEKFITLGGIQQWITIKGDDSSKPIILFLHGGPGSVMSAYNNTIYGGWEKEFTLVQWDQEVQAEPLAKMLLHRLMKTTGLKIH